MTVQPQTIVRPTEVGQSVVRDGAHGVTTSRVADNGRVGILFDGALFAANYPADECEVVTAEEAAL